MKSKISQSGQAEECTVSKMSATEYDLYSIIMEGDF